MPVDVQDSCLLNLSKQPDWFVLLRKSYKLLGGCHAVGGFLWLFQLHCSCEKGNLSQSHQVCRKLWVLKSLFSGRERKNPSLKAKLLLSKNKLKYSSDFQEAHFSVHQKNAARDLLIFLISVYVYKYIYSRFHFRWSWSLPSIITLTWGKCWRALCGGKSFTFSITFPTTLSSE